MVVIKKSNNNILNYAILSPLVIFIGLIIFGFTTGYAQSNTGIEKSLKSYHKIHIKEVGLECTDCHTAVKEIGSTVKNLKDKKKPMKMKRKKGEMYKNASYIVVNSGILMISPTSARSRVNREVCLDCHDSGDKAWYGDKKMKAGDAYKKDGR